MNKAALMTSGRKLEGGQLYLLSVFDLEPSGVIVHAYNQITSKEYMLPVLEKELAAANLTRSKAHLSSLLESVKMVPAGGEYVLQSDYEAISKIKRRPTGEEVEALIKAPMAPGKESIHSLLVTGCVELCKVKPVGVDAVEWLGDWLLANNPNKPSVQEVYDVVEPEE
eukprot:GSChrysophyteH2.ASY1.ANO1.362.1 assembled CDS